MLSQHITKEGAKDLIMETIQEFQNEVMIPLDRNIDNFDRERNKDAITLHGQFSVFSEAVSNMTELSNSIFEASALLRRYLSPNERSDSSVETPFMINNSIYRKSAIVIFAISVSRSRNNSFPIKSSRDIF